MKTLVELSSRALARMIEGKTPEEIRETFHLPDDLTEEEKLEPVKNVADDPRIRLLNRLYAKKRKVSRTACRGSRSLECFGPLNIEGPDVNVIDLSVKMFLEAYKHLVSQCKA